MSIPQSDPPHNGAAGSDEQTLIRALRNGDPDALNRIAERHWAVLVAYGREFADSNDHAKDLAQEALLRLWNHRLRFEGRGAVRGYLLRTIRSLALNEHRARTLRARPEAQARIRQLHIDSAPPRPDAWAEQRELSARIDAALAQLPERRREALVLVRFGGLSYREAADVMGTSPQTVANQVTQALKDLRVLLR